jgi:hypothetical protein
VPPTSSATIATPFMMVIFQLRMVAPHSPERRKTQSRDRPFQAHEKRAAYCDGPQSLHWKCVAAAVGGWGLGVDRGLAAWHLSDSFARPACYANERVRAPFLKWRASFNGSLIRLRRGLQGQRCRCRLMEWAMAELTRFRYFNVHHWQRLCPRRRWLRDQLCSRL